MRATKRLDIHACNFSLYGQATPGLFHEHTINIRTLVEYLEPLRFAKKGCEKEPE